MSELEKEFPGRVETRNLDATTPEAARAVAELGFRSHGLVVRSPTGEVLATQPDHSFDHEALRSTLRGLLGG